MKRLSYEHQIVGARARRPRDSRRDAGATRNHARDHVRRALSLDAMDRRLPLSALLSHALVAFTIEFDNEFEHRVPHRTTNHGSTGSGNSPWLVSMVMWLKFLRFVPVDGISVRELKGLTRSTEKELRTWLTRLGKWWGYVVVEPDASQSSSSRAGIGWVVRPTPGGVKALEAWRTLTGIIEKRWQERFGQDVIARLKKSLQALVDKSDDNLPDFLPILGYDLLSKCPDREPSVSKQAAASEYGLPILLSKVLLAFAVEFESGSGMSLAVSANVLRVVGEEGVRVRDVQRLAGVSKEAVAASLGRLEERGFIVVKAATSGSRVKTVTLTSRGRIAQDAYHRLVGEIEENWQVRLGKDAVDNLRESLERLGGDGTAQHSPLFRGLEPYPEGWRAAVAKLEALPDYPMVLHRGGFPDGS
jgi:DNA-binding MarR family transcriptional regulator